MLMHMHMHMHDNMAVDRATGVVPTVTRNNTLTRARQHARCILSSAGENLYPQ